MRQSIVLACNLLTSFVFSCTTSHDTLADKNTNWLRGCTEDTECEGEMSCICGVCTTACSRQTQCDPFGAAACRPGDVSLCGPAETASACFLECDGDGDCSSLAGGYCEKGLCLPGEWTAPQAENPDAGSNDAGDRGANPDASDDSGPPVTNPCQTPGVCNPIAPWPGDNSCTAAPSAASRPACDADGACSAGICHLDGTCIEPGQCDEKGVATLAISDGPVSKIAVDDRYVYWADYGTEDYLGNYRTDGKIARVPIHGGATQILKNDAYQPSLLLVDPSHVYWNEARNTNSFLLWEALKDGSETPKIFFEDTDVIAIPSDRPYFVGQDTANIYYMASTVQGNSLTISMLPKKGDIEPIRLLDGFDAGAYAGISVGEEHVFIPDREQGAYVGIPKASNADRIPTACPLDGLGRVNTGVTYNDGQLYDNECGPFECQVLSCSITQATSLVIFLGKEEETVLNLKYYGDKVYLLYSSSSNDAGPVPLMQIIAAPSVPTGSPDDTVVVEEWSIDAYDLFVPDIDVSGSGIFWVGPYNGSSARNRIMRRIHQ